MGSDEIDRHHIVYAFFIFYKSSPIFIKKLNPRIRISSRHLRQVLAAYFDNLGIQLHHINSLHWIPCCFPGSTTITTTDNPCAGRNTVTVSSGIWVII